MATAHANSEATNQPQTASEVDVHVAAVVAFDRAIHGADMRFNIQRDIIIERAIAHGAEFEPIVARLKGDYHYAK
ncbi:uncharacterized protein PHACADRAFT_201684 [Phanerochaete carnosa HHB-10118-sp]|uniref:Uncharacterized protein n=1 Tax=Phanerochaete carnosa (strain HHB-10118-sp) TaxID=650164 RepID=K5WGU5_PHACS|nr:uncharacterized protein PHACADRAFT_201684 [Phanerochaete carnosa HHB-10118-sp]EKM49422.1 hypothetical protein PHACADRAFT_201684 [Phanerochaete carnosa HHB-10118-sp]